MRFMVSEDRGTNAADGEWAIIRYSSPTPRGYPPKWAFCGGVAFRWPVTVARNACLVCPSLNVVPLMVKALVDEIVFANTTVNVPTPVFTACWCNVEVRTGMPDRNESGFAKLAGAVFR